MVASTQFTNALPDYTLFGVCLTLLLMLVVYRRRRKVNNGLKGIPGPRQFVLGKYLNLLEFANKRRTVTALCSWCENKGPIVRLEIGPFDLVTLLSPNYIQKLLSSNIGGHLGKPSIGYDDSKPVSWFDGILHSKGDKWKSRRKLISPFLSYTSVLGYVPIMNGSAKVLIRELEAHFESSEPRPIYNLLLDTTTAVLLKTIFGVDLYEDGGSGSDASKTFARMFKRDLEIGGTLMTQPWLRYEPIFRFHPLCRERDAYFKFSSEFILQLIKELQKRSANETGTKSLLSDLVNAGLPPEGIYEETITMITAGMETTGGVLHSLLFFLALHPAIQEECRKEVDSIFENNVFCPEGQISASGLKQLRYVEQCLMECLRMSPPAPLFLRELSDSLVLDHSLELPAGTSVALWLPAVHMNPTYYPEPQNFDPSRWTPEAKSGRHPYAYLPFAGGPRTCIGTKLAMAELLTLTAHVLRHFTITTTDKFEDVIWLLNITLHPETQMKFLFQLRTFPPMTAAANPVWQPT